MLPNDPEWASALHTAGLSTLEWVEQPGAQDPFGKKSVDAVAELCDGYIICARWCEDGYQTHCSDSGVAVFQPGRDFLAVGHKDSILSGVGKCKGIDRDAAEAALLWLRKWAKTDAPANMLSEALNSTK